MSYHWVNKEGRQISSGTSVLSVCR